MELDLILSKAQKWFLVKHQLIYSILMYFLFFLKENNLLFEKLC